MHELRDVPSPPACYAPVDREEWPMLGNDKENCCTCAAAAHMIHAWSAARQKPVIVDEAHVLAAYIMVSGGCGGAAMLDVLHYWQHKGIGERKLDRFLAFNAHDTDQIRVAVFLFGGAYIGMWLPDFVMPGAGCSTAEWVVPAAGPIGDAVPNEANGHCVAAIGYDDQGIHVVSCGAVRKMSWDFYRAYNDEAYALLSPDWYGDEKRTPGGVELAVLEREARLLRQAREACVHRSQVDQLRDS